MGALMFRQLGPAALAATGVRSMDLDSGALNLSR